MLLMSSAWNVQKRQVACHFPVLVLASHSKTKGGPGLRFREGHRLQPCRNWELTLFGFRFWFQNERETSGAKAPNKKALRCDGTTEVVPFPKPRASHSSNGVRSASFYPERPSLSAEPASAPNLPQHRTCLSTEHSSVLPRVNIASQREMSFWNSGDCAESACRNHPTLGRATDANFRIHCLFTVIHCYFWQGKIANSRNP